MKKQRIVLGLFIAMMVSIISLNEVASANQPERMLKQDAREAARLEARIDRLWVREWEKFSVFYVPFEDGFACFPDYAPGRGGNGPMSIEEYTRTTAYEIEYQNENRRNRSVVVTKPAEDAQAAMWLLSDPKPGDFGYIHSGLIREIVDEDEVVLSHAALVDWMAVLESRRVDHQRVLARSYRMVTGRDLPEEDQPSNNSRQATQSLGVLRPMIREAVQFQYADREAAYEIQKTEALINLNWRVIGFNTQLLTRGARWPQGEVAEAGLRLAVVAVEEDGTVIAIPLALLEREMTEVQFLDVMQDRGISKAQFYEWVMAARREHGRDGYVRVVLDQIEAAEASVEEPEAVEPENPDAPPVNDTVELAD